MTSQATAVNVTVSAVVFSGPCTYRGASLQNTAVTAATVRIYDGTSAAGTLLATATLAASGGTFLDNVSDGVRAGTGLFFSTSGGTVEGSVRVG